MEIGDADLGAVVAGLAESIGDEVVFRIGVGLAIGIVLDDDRSIDLVRLGETIDGVHDGRTSASFELLGLIEILDGILDRGDRDLLVAGLGLGHELNDEVFLFSGESAAVGIARERDAETGEVGLGHDKLLWSFWGDWFLSGDSLKPCERFQ